MDTKNTAERYTRLTKTAQDFINSYNFAFNEGDVTYLSSILTKSCIRHYAPCKVFELLPGFAQGRTNAQYEQQESAMWSAFSKCESSIVDMAVDDRQNKVWVYAQHNCVKKDGTIYPIENTYTLWMEEESGNETSPKMVVNKILQYTDTLTAKEMLDLQGSL